MPCPPHHWLIATPDAPGQPLKARCFNCESTRTYKAIEYGPARSGHTTLGAAYPSKEMLRAEVRGAAAAAAMTVSGGDVWIFDDYDEDDTP